MNQKQISTIKKHLAIKNGQVMTTSLYLANFFDKKHKNILQAVMDLECPRDFAGLNFRPGSYADAQGQMRPMLEITRKGFILLAMGFTGARAMEFKIAYMEAFDQMEQAMGDRASLITYLLAAKPLWRDIKRYKEMGLTQVEIARLTGLRPRTISQHAREMEKCGLLAPPADLARRQAIAQQYLPGLETQS